MPKKEIKPTKKNKGGRPKWTPTEEDIKRVEKYAAHGLSREQIACFFDKNRDTIFERMKDNPAFSDAIKKGDAMAAGTLLDSYWKRVKSGSDACIIFGLKTRLGWKETQVVESTGKNGGPVQHSINVNEPEDETRKRIREIMGGE
jgi:hypothetical protein